MILNYNITHNGIFYPAGTDVPMGVDSPKVTSDVKVEPKVIEEPKVEEVVEKKYTKTDINRMSTKELRELANANGINGNDFVGSELKEMLIEKLV